jgi:hypothetical protein
MIREGAMPSKYPALSWLCLSISKQFGPGSLEDPVSFESLSSRRRRRTWILQHLPGSAGAGSAAHAALQQADKASRSASPQETGSWVQGPRGGCVCVCKPRTFSATMECCTRDKAAAVLRCKH